MDRPVKLEKDMIEAIEKALSSGKRVELLLTSNGQLKAYRSQRTEIKMNR